MYVDVAETTAYQVVRQVYSGLKSSLTTLGRVVEAVVDPVRDGKELLLLAVKLQEERRGRRR